MAFDFAAAAVTLKEISVLLAIVMAAYAGFHTYGEYAQLRAYEAQELALRRADPEPVSVARAAALLPEIRSRLLTTFPRNTGGELAVKGGEVRNMTALFLIRRRSAAGRRMKCGGLKSICCAYSPE